MATEKVLIIGAGGREHAIAWKLSCSPNVSQIVVAPGNGGTEKNGKIENVALKINNSAEVVSFCKSNEVKLVVVGPEDPLANGLADDLNAAGIKCFGPNAKGARIEADKSYAKDFMIRHGIPTARYCSFTDAAEAKRHIQEANYAALVVKASGLAAGKGVVVAANKEEAIQAVDMIMTERAFGDAGRVVVIEELLIGEEASCLGFTDGKDVFMMPLSQDHKRLLDGDRGPNTGGMGAYCPCSVFTDADYLKKAILQKTVDGMRQDGIHYVGVLYAGLMFTASGVYVLEFNCRFGDPETQVLLPLLESDLYAVMCACVNGTLAQCHINFYSDRSAVGVVLASGGYPNAYKKGIPIQINASLPPNEFVFHAGTRRSGDNLVSDGGRVLSAVAVGSSIEQAVARALELVRKIKLEGSVFRSDIGRREIERRRSSLTYKAAGVSIDAGDSLVDRIKAFAKQTRRPGADMENTIGLFGAPFDLKQAGNYKDPLLVSGCDGVGTKLLIAQKCNLVSTVGIDLVAMCVNDIVCHGAEPLFFLDYYACGWLSVDFAAQFIEGVSGACKESVCALIGGETAEMPGLYARNDFDAAGFAVGIVEREAYLPHIGSIQSGDVVIGLASSGVHSNGFSLVRKIVERSGLRYTDPCPFDKQRTFGEVLLTPTELYVRPVLSLMKDGVIKAAAHITGGGLVENIPRVLPDHLGVELTASSWTLPPIFGWLQQTGSVPMHDMVRTFNCGVGFVVIVKPQDGDRVLERLRSSNVQAWKIGAVKQRGEQEPAVSILNLEMCLRSCCPMDPLLAGQKKNKKKVAVLISGSGTNLQAIIDSTTSNPRSHAEIVLVLSNVAGVQGLERAQQAGIPTRVLSHKGFATREEYDMAVHQTLLDAGVELICLAGFMRILSGQFTRLWEGRLLNIHPSLLPSFRGAHPHKLAIEAGVRMSGCTVHFVAEEVDAGAIIGQDSVPVYPDDTEETLQERVKTAEHRLFPRILELVAGDAVELRAGKAHWNSLRELRDGAEG